MKAVLDTNVFISGIHWTGTSEKVLMAWNEGKFELVSSLEIIEELVKILINFKVPMDVNDISWWESLILEKSIIVVLKEKVDIIKEDPDDNKFIEAAIEGKVDYIVSYDKHLLRVKNYKGVKIITPEEFLRIVN